MQRNFSKNRFILKYYLQRKFLNKIFHTKKNCLNKNFNKKKIFFMQRIIKTSQRNGYKTESNQNFTFLCHFHKIYKYVLGYTLHLLAQQKSKSIQSLFRFVINDKFVKTNFDTKTKLIVLSLSIDIDNIEFCKLSYSINRYCQFSLKKVIGKAKWSLKIRKVHLTE